VIWFIYLLDNDFGNNLFDIFVGDIVAIIFNEDILETFPVAPAYLRWVYAIYLVNSNNTESDTEHSADRRTEPAQVNPGALPMVFANDMLYLYSPLRYSPVRDESWVFIGELDGHVSGRPEKHLQTNFEVVGVARVYHSPVACFRMPLHSEEIFGEHIFGEIIGNGVVINANGQSYYFVSEDVHIRINEMLSQRVPQLLYIDDELYILRATSSGGDFQMVDGYAFLGEITSNVSPLEFPTVNFQANDELIGARVYRVPPNGEVLYDLLVVFQDWRMEYSRYITTR
jgi:hypothetical protein